MFANQGARARACSLVLDAVARTRTRARRVVQYVRVRPNSPKPSALPSAGWLWADRLADEETRATPLSHLGMPGPTPQSKEELEQAAHDYGIAPGGRAMMLAEIDAADYSASTGVYIVWRTMKSGESSEGVRKEGQCCRLGPNSRCFCGHSLAEHKSFKQGNPQAPACAKCKCRRFSYVPMRPEECGMWHLPRRKGFNVHLWRAPCKCNCGHDKHDPVTHKCNGCGNCRVFTPNYVCIGCDGRGDQHETIFETESERVMARLPVGDAYKPLSDSPYLLQQVLEGAKRSEFKGAKGGGRLAAPKQSPEELLDSGKIDIAEYRRLIALPPEPTPPASAQRGLAVVNGETRLGAGLGPTGREYAQAGATVKAMSIPVEGGGSIDILTNMGKPMPQPGKDFSRPWEPAPPRRPHPMASGAPKLKEPLRPQIEDITPTSERAGSGGAAETTTGPAGVNWLDDLGASMSNMFGGSGNQSGGDNRSGGGASAQESVRSRAASSGTSSSSRGGGSSGGKLSAKERLLELNELLNAGLVSQDEYDVKRRDILSGV